MAGLSSEGSEEAATQSPPNPPNLTIEEHGDHLVPVKIDGETKMMRLRDAVRGVAHQETATRALADLDVAKKDNQKYEQFFAQLQQDPERIVRSLRERFGLETYSQEDEEQVEQPEDQVTALTQQLEELKGMLSEQQQQHVQDAETARINRRLEELEAQFGDAFDRKAILAHAVNKGISDVDLAFRSWFFENQQNGQEPAPAPGAVKQAAVLDSIAPGSPVATPPPPEPANVPVKNEMDAIRRAIETLPDDSIFRGLPIG